MDFFYFVTFAENNKHKQMKINRIIFFMAIGAMLIACKKDPSIQDQINQQETKQEIVEEKFDYNVEQFADIKVLRYQIPGWENLSLKEQKLVYYLTQAGLSGRDIMWDQNYRHNLQIRKALENVYTSYAGLEIF